jgi:hypothetical protein
LFPQEVRQPAIVGVQERQEFGGRCTNAEVSRCAGTLVRLPQ